MSCTWGAIARAGTISNNVSPVPASDPAVGLLYPTEAKPSPEPSPSPAPSTEPTPADSVPPAVSADDPFTPVSQPTTVSDATGCGLKRSDEPCLGPSDNIGDDVPGEAPDTVAPTRQGRPVDDSAVANDYLHEVQSERGTGLVNDKLTICRPGLPLMPPMIRYARTK